MAVSTKDIRNVVLISHAGEGKTTLAESLLFAGDAIPRKGSVSGKNTVSDFCDDEKERGNSINLAVAHYKKGSVKVNLIDTPGFLDYIGEVYAGIAAADAAIVMVDAVGGVKVGTNKFWKIAKERNIPALVVVNKMDKENADYAKALEGIKNTIGRNAVAIGYPVGVSSTFEGMANLLTKTGIDKLPDEDKKKADELSNALVEGIAESDDALIEKYLEEGALEESEITPAFRKGVIEGKIIPIVPAAVESGKGVDEIMDIIEKYFPSPLDGAPAVTEESSGEGEDAAPVVVEAKSDLPFSARVFKTISDPFAGQISIFRINSGILKANQTVKNSTKGATEKFGHIFAAMGKDLVEVDSAEAGDIIAVVKLKNTDTNDTLCEDKKETRFKKIAFPEPAVSFSVKPKSRSDEDKIAGALSKLIAEDPAFSMLRDPVTHELVISGMGDLHLKTMVTRLKDRYGVDVEIGTPKVAYKETITANGDSQYRHKKQSGGAGQFAEVWMRIEPLPRGEGYEFVDEVVGGAIPKQLIGSTEKGVKNALGKGIVAGFPVVDVKVTVYDGKTHPVDSKDIAFQIAGAQAFRQSCEKAKPVLLEPIMHVELSVPEENMGDITGSLSTRRGRVQGMSSEGGMQVVEAEIPLEEMYKYANELKSITAGRATYTMSFAHYEVVPSNIAQKIISENKRETKEE